MRRFNFGARAAARLATKSLGRRKLRFETLEDKRMLATVPNGFTESVVASDLTSPITMDIEASGRIWLAYQDGRIEVIEDDQLLPQVFQLDADGSGERGLQGIELDPDFETNHHIFVYYTAASPESHNRLSRLTVDPLTENTIIPGSEEILLELPLFSTFPQNQSPIWHMGGAIHFMADETIAVQVGDHLNNSLVQDLDQPLGKILRVNRDGSPASDNPYYDAGDGISWRDHVWAAGLRNPFSGDIDPVTGQYFINDVGEVTWEEINDATDPGHNFGWPTTEGMFNPATFPDFTNPTVAYNHGEDCAITGGAFNSFVTPPVAGFPVEFNGHYFYSQFCAGRILVIDPDNPGDADEFITDAAFPMNIEFGPDGSMYYIARGAGAGGAPGIGTGQVLKVQYAVDIAPQIVQHPDDVLVSDGYDATFTVSAAGTPTLTYQWQVDTGEGFVDIPEATNNTLTVLAPSLADDGNQYRVVVVNGIGMTTSNPATLSVTIDTPPTVEILTPGEGAVYRAGDLVDFSGLATDAEDGDIDPASMTWQIDFHHDEHLHPFFPPTSGLENGGQFEIPVNSETSPNVYYRVHLIVTDSAGLTTETIRDIHPVTTDFVVQTNAGDTNVLIDGQPKATPEMITGVVNVNRALEAPAGVLVEGQSGVFLQWLDGETDRQRTIATPENDTAYVAIYQTNSAAGFVYASDLPWASQENGWGDAHRDISNGEQDDGETSGPITINGVEYAKGIGAHADSEIVIELDGLYERFISDIGLDDENTGGSLEFLVYGDDVLLFESGQMGSGSPTQTVDVSVAGVQELRLVLDALGGNGNDHADWADARLTGAVVFLSELNWESATNGFGPVERNTSNGEDAAGDGGPIEINDIIYPKGLGVHANSEIVYNLGGIYTRFLSDVGIDDEVEEFDNDADGSVIFRVFADDVEVFTSTEIDGNDPTESVDIDITGVQTLRLVVEDLGGNGDDHADWGNALLVSAEAPEEFVFPFLSADTTLNGKLTYKDVLAFGAGWGAHNGGDDTLEQLVKAGDLNFDYVTDEADWDIFNAAWNDAGMPPISLEAVINPIAGDFNRDGTVDEGDNGLWRSTYGSADELAADGNGDGLVNTADYVVWRNNEGETIDPGAGTAATTTLEHVETPVQTPTAAEQTDPVLPPISQFASRTSASSSATPFVAPGSSVAVADDLLLLLAGSNDFAATSTSAEFTDYDANDDAESDQDVSSPVSTDLRDAVLASVAAWR